MNGNVRLSRVGCQVGNGARCKVRTCHLRFRRPMLYPNELIAHILNFVNLIGFIVNLTFIAKSPLRERTAQHRQRAEDLL